MKEAIFQFLFLSALSSRVILASPPSFHVSLSIVLISLQIKCFFSQVFSEESELHVLVFYSDELSDKSMSTCLSWKAFILFLKLTLRDVLSILFPLILSFCLFSLFNISVKLCSFSSSGVFIWDHDFLFNCLKKVYENINRARYWCKLHSFVFLRTIKAFFC